MTIRDLIYVLKTAYCAEDIDVYRNQILSLIPECPSMIGFDQRNKVHQFDLWEHSLNTVVNVPKWVDDDMLYLAALLHDIGKPECIILDKSDPTIYHYYGHPEVSASIVEKMVERFDLSDTEKKRLIYYVKNHDAHIGLRKKYLFRQLRSGATLEEFINLMWLQCADAKAHVLLPVIKQRLDVCTEWAEFRAKKIYFNRKENELCDYDFKCDYCA